MVSIKFVSWCFCARQSAGCPNCTYTGHFLHTVHQKHHYTNQSGFISLLHLAYVTHCTMLRMWTLFVQEFQYRGSAEHNVSPLSPFEWLTVLQLSMPAKITLVLVLCLFWLDCLIYCQDRAHFRLSRQYQGNFFAVKYGPTCMCNCFSGSLIVDEVVGILLFKFFLARLAELMV